MIRNIPKYLLVILITLLVQKPLNAQEKEIGVWIGAANYFGDLNPRYSFKESRWAMGALFRYNLANKRMALRAGLSYGRITADDLKNPNPYPQARGLNFRSEILEVAALYELNFFKYEPGSKTHFVTPYFFAGISAFYYNPLTNTSDGSVTLAQVGTEGQFAFDATNKERYSAIGFAIPFGGGIKWALTANWALNLEMSTRKTFTDYIDDVSTNYKAIADLTNEQAIALADPNGIGRPGKQRGTSPDVDRFNFYSLGITYTIQEIKCPPIYKRSF